MTYLILALSLLVPVRYGYAKKCAPGTPTEWEQKGDWKRAREWLRCRTSCKSNADCVTIPGECGWTSCHRDYQPEVEAYIKELIPRVTCANPRPTIGAAPTAFCEKGICLLTPTEKPLPPFPLPKGVKTRPHHHSSKHK